jgi:hypothetical protein
MKLKIAFLFRTLLIPLTFHMASFITSLVLPFPVRPLYGVYFLRVAAPRFDVY